MNTVNPKQILFIQYTNPAAYPPLEHASRILASHGTRVKFLGVQSDGSGALTFPEHSMIDVRTLPRFGRGVMEQIRYATYTAWVLWHILRFQPSWVYASDPLSCLPAWLAIKLFKSHVVYHEHDAPANTSSVSTLMRLILKCRAKVGRHSEVLVIPQKTRLEIFVKETQRSRLSICAWNCPRVEEVTAARDPLSSKDPLRFYFHGSINQTRLPLTTLDALATTSKEVTLVVIGYETLSSQGYMDAFLSHARALGLQDRVRFLGPKQRREIMRHAKEVDVGLVFMPNESDDTNMRHMVGASNKAFDFLAAGTMLIVTDQSEWNETYVKPGYGIACNPYDLSSLAEAFQWCENNRQQVRRMGEAGRQRVLKDWNYETQFTPVLCALRDHAADYTYTKSI